ncbi:MAG: acetylxylan esterase [Anaerolineae bacterium]|nr:acetylxylan esterase [Anaerolineae bacterium]
MPLYDKPLEELVVYNPPLTKEADFDAFWEETLAASAQEPLDPQVEEVDYPAVGVHVYRVSYKGWQGARIRAWYLVPEGEGPFPALVQYHGYGGSKLGAHQYLGWALQGYVVMAVDVRGQSGESDDPARYPGGHIRGWMTMGVMDPNEYYYRGVYVDCVRALDFVSSRPEVNSAKIGILGGSQGGGLTLAVAALDTRLAVAMPEMPYLCHFKRAVEMAVQGPYLEIADYIKRWPDRAEQVWRTLSYFDNMNLAPRILCPVLMSVGLQDDVCPPSTVFAVYNKITAPKKLQVYPFHRHESVDAHWEEKLRWAHYFLKGIGRIEL